MRGESVKQAQNNLVVEFVITCSGYYIKFISKRHKVKNVK